MVFMLPLLLSDPERRAKTRHDIDKQSVYFYPISNKFTQYLSLTER